MYLASYFPGKEKEDIVERCDKQSSKYIEITRRENGKNAIIALFV